jgi:hypothetical protein
MFFAATLSCVNAGREALTKGHMLEINMRIGFLARPKRGRTKKPKSLKSNNAVFSQAIHQARFVTKSCNKSYHISGRRGMNDPFLQQKNHNSSEDEAPKTSA